MALLLRIALPLSELAKVKVPETPLPIVTLFAAIEPLAVIVAPLAMLIASSELVAPIELLMERVLLLLKFKVPDPDDAPSILLAKRPVPRVKTEPLPRVVLPPKVVKVPLEKISEELVSKDTLVELMFLVFAVMAFPAEIATKSNELYQIPFIIPYTN